MTTKTTTTFMETMTKWAETNGTVWSSMTKTTQQCWEKSFSAGQIWADGVTVASKRSQQAMTEWMEKSTAAMSTISSCKEPTKAVECTMDYAVSTCCDAIETGSEISQLLTKSCTEAQQSMTKTMLSSLESLKKDGAKVVKSSETTPWGTATSMTAWWTNPEQATSWMKTTWWTPATGTTKTSAGETAATTGAMIAAKSATGATKTATTK
jgi:hypothetical protein